MTALKAGAEPRLLWVDASFRDGHAGLAIVDITDDAKGTILSTCVIQVESSSKAEFAGVKWAKRLAHERKLLPVRIFTDCQSALHRSNQGRKITGIEVTWRPRHGNRAHLPAAHALLGQKPFLSEPSNHQPSRKVETWYGDIHSFWKRLEEAS